MAKRLLQRSVSAAAADAAAARAKLQAMKLRTTRPRANQTASEKLNERHADACLYRHRIEFGRCAGTSRTCAARLERASANASYCPLRPISYRADRCGWRRLCECCGANRNAAESAKPSGGI